MSEIVEFTVQSKENELVEISGWAYIEELDDETPLHFYNRFGEDCGSYVPTNPFPENRNYDAHMDYELLSLGFQSDEKFIQYLADACTEPQTYDKGEYLLTIQTD